MLKNLRALRESRGYTQRQLADLVGISHKSIQKYETSKYEPDIATLISLADVFEVSVDFLVGHQSKGKDPTLAVTRDELLIIEKYRGYDGPTRKIIRDLLEKISP